MNIYIKVIMSQPSGSGSQNKKTTSTLAKVGIAGAALYAVAHLMKEKEEADEAQQIANEIELMESMQDLENMQYQMSNQF